MNTVLTLLITLAASWVLTGGIREYAIRKQVLDVPNERSSHKVPTPRGGGLAIVIVFFAALTWLWSQQPVSVNLLSALLGGGGLVAAIGLWDDHRSLSARTRLVGHFVAAAWGLYWLGGFPSVVVFGVTLDFGWVGYLFGVLFLVWMLNLYNFMDGINGIAGIQAITTCGGAAWLCSLEGMMPLSLILGLLAVSAVGFLAWNFPVGRIFMGDVGSGFLGLVIGLLAIAAGSTSSLLCAFLVLMAVFVTDATVTLLARIWRKEPVHVAHRDHAYQVAATTFGSHLPVTLGVMTINLLLLLPLAYLMVVGVLDPGWGIVLAYLPLGLLVAFFKGSGRKKLVLH